MESIRKDWYLKSMKEYLVFSAVLTIFIIILLNIIRNLKKKIKNECAKVDKYNELYKLMVQWMEAKQNGQSITVWLRENNYRTVAIYGFYLIGECLYVELLNEGVDVRYGIDGKSRANIEGIKIYKPTDELPEVDVIIVTAVSDYEIIKKKMQDRVKGKIYSIKDILNEVSIQ